MELDILMDKKKVLIIKLGAIGDVIHTTVIAKAVKQKHPDWTVDYLTDSGIAVLLENNPYIDNIHKWVYSKNKDYKYWLEVGLTLSKEHYDIVLNPTLSFRTLFVSFLAFPKKFSTKKSLGGLWVEDYFQMAKRVIKDLELPDRLYLGTTEQSDRKIEEEIKDYPKPHFVISPGRNNDKIRPGRVWNINKWKVLTEKLYNEYKGTVFVIGRNNERDYHDILSGNGVVIKTGEYTLNESSSLLAKTDLMISGDTGPVHIASAHNTKTLAILGSTSPKQIKPYGENGHYISANYDCIHCWKKNCKRKADNEVYTPCMEALSAEEVFEKIKEIF